MTFILYILLFSLSLNQNTFSIVDRTIKNNYLIIFFFGGGGRGCGGGGGTRGGEGKSSIFVFILFCFVLFLCTCWENYLFLIRRLVPLIAI